MNDSNQSLRFSRTYLEETGIRSSLLQFNEDTPPMVSKKEALLWIVAAATLAIIVYILKVA